MALRLERHSQPGRAGNAPAASEDLRRACGLRVIALIQANEKLPGSAFRQIREHSCGAKEIRTPDLFDANEALYQLSYSPGTVRVLARTAAPVTLGYKFLSRIAN
jgi:hypothetical protein